MEKGRDLNNLNNEYKNALDYLFSRLPMFSRIGAAAYKPGLDTVRKLAKFFDNPHTKFKSIHIGGTNGKGSTSHILASVLQEEGYKVGLYTSPHLKDFRERIRINGEMIPQEKVVEFVEAWKKSGFDGSPSFFELTMIMAFNWFAKEKVDYAVIEVGMGGRLDSTNIITPELSVITNISHDHNQFLGDTLKKIAHEKAGIIKPGIPIVVGEYQEETKKVFQEKAKKEGSPLIFASETELPDKITPEKRGWKIVMDGEELTLPLGGDYQKKNLVTALTAIKKLKDIGVNLSNASIIKGVEKVIENTGLAGRWMILSETPLTIADTGHNEAGIKYNFHQLLELIKNRPGGELRVVIGFVADKSIDKILRLLPKKAEYYVTNAQIPRALDAAKLLEKFKAEGFNAQKFGNVEAAYSKALEDSKAEDIIFIGGSTFIVADFLQESSK